MLKLCLKTAGFSQLCHTSLSPTSPVLFGSAWRYCCSICLLQSIQVWTNWLYRKCQTCIKCNLKNWALLSQERQYIIHWPSKAYKYVSGAHLLQGDICWLFCEFQNLEVGIQNFENGNLKASWFTVLKWILFPLSTLKWSWTTLKVSTLSFSQVINLYQRESICFPTISSVKIYIILSAMKKTLLRQGTV